MPNWLRGIVDRAQANRVVALGIAGGVLVVLVFILSPGEQPQGVQEQAEDDWFGGEALPGDVTTAKALSDMQVAQEVLQASVRALRAENAQLKSLLQLQKERVDVQDRTLQKRLDDAVESGLTEAVERLAQRQPDAATVTTAPPPPRLRVLRADDKTPPAPQAPLAAQVSEGEAAGPWVHLPAGSQVAGRILTGAFATKVRGDGLPVLARLEAAYLAPNDYEVPLEGCLMIGKATADLQTIRARVEAVTLSCVLPNGEVFERKVRGYFTGEDGTLGIAGTWQHRSGAWLGNLLAAMGTAAGGVYGSVQINEALGGADLVLGDRTLETTERIETFFLDRAEEILPVVLVETLTPVYVVMLEGVTIEGLPETDHVPWSAAGLD